MQCTDINFYNLPSSISEFFTPEQFAEISEYEKQLLSNLRQHFEMLRLLEFMLRNISEKERRKPITPAVIESSNGSDSERAPVLEKPKRPSGVYLELNYAKLHPDLSLGVNGLTKVQTKLVQHDVNFI
ncbi:hypothetical protein BsWGS_25183 [Bradybaena similaris]